MDKGTLTTPYGAPIPNDLGSYSNLNSTFDQTIHYISRSTGKSIYPDASQSIPIYRNVKINLVTGEAVYSPGGYTSNGYGWTTTGTSTTHSPSIPGYRLDGPADVTLNDANGLSTVNVIYTPIDQTASIQLVDAVSGQAVGDPVTFSSTIENPGSYDLTSQINKAAGYELAPGQSATGTIKYDEDGKPVPVEIKLAHKTTTINPDGPYTNGVTASDLNRTNTETIHYKYADGSQAAPDKVQTVTATRTATVDEVTGDVTYSDWTNVSFAEVVSPAIPGYTASEGSIAAVEDVTSDVEATVLYTKNALPNTGDNGSTGSKTNNGSQSHNGSGNNGGSTTGTNETGTTSSGTGSTTNGGSSTTNTSSTTDNVGGTNSAATQTGNTAATSHQLPSTGDSNSTALVAAGVAAMLGTLGLASTKRRRA